MNDIFENVDVLYDSKFGRIYKFLVIKMFILRIVVSKNGLTKIKIYTHIVSKLFIILGLYLKIINIVKYEY